MKIEINLTEDDLKEIILTRVRHSMQNNEILTKDIIIEVKSKQNYKSEWEVASFRATYKGEL